MKTNQRMTERAEVAPSACFETMEGRTLMSATLSPTAVCPSDPSLQDGTSNTIMYAEKYSHPAAKPYSPATSVFYLRNTNA
jgi:hypothetical protein